MVTAESKNNKYLTELSNGRADISSDVITDKGGSGEYFDPHDLICAGLASCINITTRMVLDRMELKYDRVVTNVELDRDNDDKSLFKYHIDIIGDVDEETKKLVIAKVSGCPVKKTLSKAIDFQLE